MNDVYAMGGSGLAALAMATVPLMTQEMMEDELYRLLLGAVEVLNADGVPLVGGHSAEGGELALSLTVTGTQGAAPLRKSGMRPGDVLVLTKALGTGVILAAHMRGAAGSDLLAAAIASMDHSNAAALAVLRDYGVGALTDVSGFGLLGHLGEMLRASRLGAVVRTADVATLPGALGCLTAGHASSLQAGNALALTDFELQGLGPADAAARILVDPQTSGGLLGAVPAASAAECVAALRRAGYPQAAVIGTVTDGPWRVEAV
jgi:selenide,water dikinase